MLPEPLCVFNPYSELIPNFLLPLLLTLNLRVQNHVGIIKHPSLRSKVLLYQVAADLTLPVKNQSVFIPRYPSLEGILPPMFNQPDVHRC